MKITKYEPKKAIKGEIFKCYLALVPDKYGRVSMVGPFGKERELDTEFRRTGFSPELAAFHELQFPYPGAQPKLPKVRTAPKVKAPVVEPVKESTTTNAPAASKKA